MIHALDFVLAKLVVIDYFLDSMRALALLISRLWLCRGIRCLLNDFGSVTCRSCGGWRSHKSELLHSCEAVWSLGWCSETIGLQPVTVQMALPIQYFLFL